MGWVILIHNKRMIAKDMANSEMSNGKNDRMPHYEIPHSVEKLNPYKTLFFPGALA